MPRTVPKTVASTGTLRKSNAASNFKMPRMSFLQSSNRATQSRGMSRSNWLGDSDSLQCVREARRRRKRSERPENLRGLQSSGSAGNQNRSRSERQVRQPKRHGGDQRLLRSLAAGHRSLHHFSQAIPAIHVTLPPPLLLLLTLPPNPP